jgi:glycosyltransferase involved in cell wall biosynthesis
MEARNDFLTSVVMITYNHEQHITEAIESILAQNFESPLELIISNDRSPDNTDSIIRNLIKTHPKGELIHYTLQPENLGVSQNFFWALSQAKGKYVALCEGDDSWTDPNKLQRQVSFLDAHPSYGLTCSGFTSLDCTSGEQKTWLLDIIDEAAAFDFGFDIELERFWNNWCVQTLTVVYRNELFDARKLSELNYQFFIDVHLFYHVIIQRKGFYFREVFGNMNLTSDGVYSTKSHLEKLRILYLARREISRANRKDAILKSKLFNVSSELFCNKAFVRTRQDLSRWNLFVDMWYSAQSFNDFKHILKCLFVPKNISGS